MKSRIIRHSTAIGATFGTTLGIAAGLTASFCSLLVYVLNSEVSLKPTLKDKFVFAGSGGLIPLFTFYGFRFGRKIGRKFAGRHVKQNATPYWTIEKKRKLYHFAIKVCTHKVTVTSTGIVISAMAANALYEKVDKALAEGWLTKRDHTKSRRISEESFKRLVRRECRISAKKKSSIAIDWSEKFRKLKYETKLENMNLSAFSEKELQFFKSTKFKNFTFLTS